MAYLGDIREDNPEKEIGIIWGNVNAVSKRYKWNGALLDLNNIDPEDTRLYDFNYNYDDRKRESNLVTISPISANNTITLQTEKPVATQLIAIVKYKYTNEYGNTDTNTITVEFENGSDSATSEVLFENGTDFKILNVFFTPEKDDKYEYKLNKEYVVDYSSLYYGVIRSKDIDIISADMVTASTYNFEVIENMQPGLNLLSFGLTTDSVEGLNDMEDKDVELLKAELSQAFVVVYDNDFKNISMTDALGMDDNTWELLNTSFTIGKNKYNVFIHRDNGDQVDLRDSKYVNDDPVIFSYNAKLI